MVLCDALGTCLHMQLLRYANVLAHLSQESRIWEQKHYFNFIHTSFHLQLL